MVAKSQLIFQTVFPNHMSLYEISSGKMILVIFRRFLNFGPFFGPFLGTLVKNAKHKKFAPCIYLHFCKQSTNPNINIWVLKCVFPKCTFSGPQTNRIDLYGIFLICQKPALRTTALIRNIIYHIDRI